MVQLGVVFMRLDDCSVPIAHIGNINRAIPQVGSVPNIFVVQARGFIFASSNISQGRNPARCCRLSCPPSTDKKDSDVPCVAFAWLWFSPDESMWARTVPGGRRLEKMLANQIGKERTGAGEQTDVLLTRIIFVAAVCKVK